MNKCDKYKIKDGVSVFLKKNKMKSNVDFSSLLFLFDVSREKLEYRLTKELVYGIKLLDGTKTIEEVAFALNSAPVDLIDILKILHNDGVIEKVTEKSRIVSDDRHSRQFYFFSSFFKTRKKTKKIIEKLNSSVVAVIGLGGIGSCVAESLVRLGINQLVVIDPDVVEISNIMRCSVYQENDIKKRKVDVFESFAKKINSSIQVVKIGESIQSDSRTKEILQKCDVVVNCADYPSTDITNTVVSGMCMELLIPHVLCGGYDGHSSYVGMTVLPHKSACWNCYLMNVRLRKIFDDYDCLEVGDFVPHGSTIFPLATLNANLHVQEVIRLITGYQKPIMLNSVGEFDSYTVKLVRTKIKRNPKCPFCSKKEV